MVAYWEIQTDRPPAHLLAALSRELKVTPEELLGLKPVPVEAPPVDMRVWKKLQKVDELDRHGRKAVLDFIDAMLAKQKAQKEKRNATSRDREKENSAVQK